MFHNYFFLKRLAEQLDKKISSFSLQACFSQNRDELILHFVKENSSFFIRANLDPNISLLAFPEHFARANRNSVDLFQSVISKKVIHIETFRYERSFAIVFEDEVKMIFKMHGRRSNILLVEKEKVVDIFRKSLHPDWDVDPSTLNKKVTITQELFQNHRENPLEMLPAIGKETKIYWEQRKYFEMEPEEKWILFEQTLNKLETNPIFLIDSNLPRLSLLNEEDRGTTNALMAANWLYDKVSKRFYVERDKKNIIGQLKQKIKRSENYISKTLRKLNEIKNSRSPEEIANILMANLHAIQTGMTKVVLHDLYSNQPISIPLKVNLSPQKNAEVYYRKSKNRHREIEILKRNIHQKEKLIEQLSAEILRVDSIENPKELRKQ
ncbi:MAG: NFACT family protein, partial [Bacteroidota bacterium]